MRTTLIVFLTPCLDHAFCFGQCPEPGAIAGGSAAAIATDMEHDELRMHPVYRLVVQSPPFQRAGAVVDDQNIADVEQLMEEVLSLRGRVIVVTGAAQGACYMCDRFRAAQLEPRDHCGKYRTGRF